MNIRLIIAISFFVLMFSSCSCSGNKEYQSNDVGSSSGYYYNSSSSSSAIEQRSTTGATLPSSVMSPAEDAYEEGRALAEEDRLNGTRSHEGDNPDEDEEDEYDDGYYDE